jgi:molecular chaperone DnaK
MSSIGIKLGTNSSAVAVLENGEPRAIKNQEGSYTTPSVVAVSKDGRWLIGHSAKQQIVLNPENTFDNLMRLIGRRYDEIAEITNQFSYQIEPDPQGGIVIDCPLLKQKFTPEDLLAKLLHQLIEGAKQHLNSPIDQVVLEVPAGFGLVERSACKKAAQIAGLDVLRIIDSCLATALTYGLNREENETIAVFKLGAGHFGGSILEVGDGVFEVLATKGDLQLGGNDFDYKIVSWLIDVFGRINRINFCPNPQALKRLIEAAETAKINLSEITEAEICLPYLTQIEGATDLQVTLTQNKFESLCSDLLDRCHLTINQLLQDAELPVDKIDHILLTGGSVRMPMVHLLIQQIFGKEPNFRLNQDELSAAGAALRGGVSTGEVKSILDLDVTQHSLGIETIGGVMTKIIPRNTTSPTKKSETFSTMEDGQKVVEIHVLEGEHEKAAHNKSLGLFRLEGIPPAPRGVPQIEVTFDIEANSVLSVRAKDKGTGKEQSISITELSIKAGEKPVLQYPPDSNKRSDAFNKVSDIYPPSPRVKVPNIYPPSPDGWIPPFPPNIYPHSTSPFIPDSSFIPNNTSKKSVADWRYCPYCEQEFSPPLQSDAKCCPLCHHPLIANQTRYPFGSEPEGYSSKRF